MPVVLDISSDEEEGLKEEPEISDLEWLKEILFMSDEESDDSDEVVIVSENKPELKSKSSTLSVKDDDSGDDDDCVVLEGDPENGVTSVDEDSNGNGSDDLLVVGEKGQVACRDYPHARHLCAKFPFSSTSHDKHCGQCHCYVCDSPAPCLWWGTGILSSDHCHANDKMELWKVQRKHFKLGQSSPLPALTNSASSPSVLPSQCNANPSRRNFHLSTSLFRNQTSKSTAVPTRPSLISISQNKASRPSTIYSRPLSLNNGMQNQVSRPMHIPVCRAGTNITIPNVVNHGRSLGSGSTLVRDRHKPHPVSLGVRNHGIQREKRRGASSLGHQFLHPHKMSKGVVGSPRDNLTVNHSPIGSSGFNNHVNAVQQRVKLHTASGFSNHINGQGNVSHPISLSVLPHLSSGLAHISSVNQHIISCESQAYSQPLPQSNDNQDLYQHIQGNDGSYMAYLNTNQHGSELPIRSQNENANGNIMQCGVTSQDTCQPKPHDEGPNVTSEIFSTLDSSWTEKTSQSIDPVIECSLQSSVSINQPVIECSLQSSVSINQPSNVEDSSTQVTGIVEPLNEHSNLPSSSSIVDIENWLFDKESAPVLGDGVLPFDFELNTPSPDLAPVDTGMLSPEWW